MKESHCFMMPRCCAYESKVLEKTLKGAEWRTAEKSKPVSYVIELTHNSNNDNTHTMGLQWSGYRNPAFFCLHRSVFSSSVTQMIEASHTSWLCKLYCSIFASRYHRCHWKPVMIAAIVIDALHCDCHLSMLLVLWLDEHKCRLRSRFIFW